MSESDPAFPPIVLSEHEAERVNAVRRAFGQGFVALSDAGGLHPGRDWCGANLANADFTAQDLTRFRFYGADLQGAKITHARNVTLDMFLGAQFDDRTRWPSGWAAQIKAGALAIDPRIRRGDPDTGLWHTQNVPQWATDWGRDKYGAWAVFSVPDANGNPVTQRMRWIVPGSFMMGSPPEEHGDDDEQPHHKVTFTAGFWMFDTACPEKLWTAVMSGPTGTRKLVGFPITDVTWHDAQAFIAALNAAKPGLDLTLPSEAMWEYCCRSGTQSLYSFGDKITKKQVNFATKGTVVVGSLPPNDWGLYEMHGNVWEWCADTWHKTYDGAPDDGSAWIDSGATNRVVRGGSWSDPARLVRAAFRSRIAPFARYDNFGFRCARVQASEAERRAGRSERQERSDQAATTGPERKRAQPKPA